MPLPTTGWSGSETTLSGGEAGLAASVRPFDDGDIRADGVLHAVPHVGIVRAGVADRVSPGDARSEHDSLRPPLSTSTFARGMERVPGHPRASRSRQSRPGRYRQMHPSHRMTRESPWSPGRSPRSSGKRIMLTFIEEALGGFGQYAGGVAQKSRSHPGTVSDRPIPGGEWYPASKKTSP